MRVVLAGGDDRGWSAPTRFLTRVDDFADRATPLWAANASAQFVLLRRAVRVALGAADGAHRYLTLSARPTPDANLPHGRETSHLLCAYKLHVDGAPLAVGPGRAVAGAVAVATFNLTDVVRRARASRSSEGEGCGGEDYEGAAAPAAAASSATATTTVEIEIEAFFRGTNAIGTAADGAGGAVLALLHDGAGVRAADDSDGDDDASLWLAFVYLPPPCGTLRPLDGYSQCCSGAF